MRQLATALPEFASIVDAAPGAKFRIAGQRLRSEPHRYTGRTAVDAARTVHEPQAFPPEAAPFTGTMEGYYGAMPAALIPYFWAPGWNSGQSLHKFQEETGRHAGRSGGYQAVRRRGPRRRSRWPAKQRRTARTALFCSCRNTMFSAAMNFPRAPLPWPN